MKKNENKNKKKKKSTPMDEWLDANLERLVHRPGFRKFFGITEEVISSMGLPPFKIRYKEQELIELAEKLNWKGSGAKNDPLIIDTNEGLPQMFTISANSLFLNIMNCKFEHIILDNSQNITIDNCSIDILGIYESSTNFIKHSTLPELNLEHCSDNYFKECSIIKAFNLKSQANTFENCTITEKATMILLDTASSFSKYVKDLRFIILIAGISLAIFIFFQLYNSIPFGFYLYLSIGTYPCLIALYVILSKNQQQLVPNKIISHENSQELI